MATRRIVIVGAPGTQILDLVGPFQIFTRAAELIAKENGSRAPIYQVEVVSTARGRPIVTNCGLGLTAHRTFRRCTGKVDTLLVAGGNDIECGGFKSVSSMRSAFQRLLGAPPSQYRERFRNE
jgi:transcriptional regulator GlxA family with amidase domain